MKLHTDTNPVERIGTTGAESQFTITSSPQAFEILSSGIYTDPKAAVVRELSCNAYDAMVDANKAHIPFRVHLPNKLEPYFSVSDDGIGLSDEDVRGLYSSYFTSTKSDDNTKIGAFGLGSKSPFSYSKAFDVISRFDGVKRHYTVFINEQGIPSITNGATIDTAECNGIEVRLAIRTDDHADFAYTTKNMLQYFPVKPIVTGRQDFEFPTPSEDASVTSKYIVDQQAGGLIAVQGNVPYRVDVDQIKSKLSPPACNFMRRHKIVLFFDIGMIDIAASREEVRYDDLTVKNLTDAVMLTFNDYLASIDDKLTELTKSGSKWSIFQMLNSEFGSRSSLEDLVGKSYRFTSDIANEWKTSDKVEYDTEWSYHTIVLYSKGNSRAVRRPHSYTGYGTDRQHHISPASSMVVALQDVTTRSSLRINEKLDHGYRSGGTKTVVAIVPISDRVRTNNGHPLATAQQRADELASITAQLGNPEVLKVSEWTDDVVPEVRANRRSGHTFRQMTSASTSNKRHSKPTLIEVPEPDDGGVYIEVDSLRNVIDSTGNPCSVTARTLRDELIPVLRVINLANGTDYKINNVYMITKKVVKAISTNTDWEHLATAYEKAIVQQKDIIAFYGRMSVSSDTSIGSSIIANTLVDVVNSLDVNSTFRKLVEPVIKLSRAANDLEKHAKYPIKKHDFMYELPKFERRHGLVRDTTPPVPFITDLDLAPYPMLQYINFSYGGAEDKVNVLEYINLIES